MTVSIRELGLRTGYMDHSSKVVFYSTHICFFPPIYIPICLFEGMASSLGFKNEKSSLLLFIPSDIEGPSK